MQYLIFALLFGIGFCFFMLIRNEIVCSIRLKINQMCYDYWLSHNDSVRDIYDKLPAYNNMLWQFTKWNYRQFISKEDLAKLNS